MSFDYDDLFGVNTIFMLTFGHLFQCLDKSDLSFEFNSFPLFFSFYKKLFNILLHLKFNYYYALIKQLVP